MSVCFCIWKKFVRNFPNREYDAVNQRQESHEITDAKYVKTCGQLIGTLLFLIRTHSYNLINYMITVEMIPSLDMLSGTMH